mmetsp:Transcript_92905/g.262984  ORF Transcript_92905/g.262984 Transcript_92905/m.262984 type:complete len:226 (+) Transcript_92905:504-1181(+)
MMMFLLLDAVSEMILTLASSPTFVRKVSAIMNPTCSSSAIARVRFAAPASIAHTKVSSWVMSGMWSRMKLARYFTPASSSRGVWAGQKPHSAWLWRSIVTNRSAPAVTMRCKSSFGAMASPASNFLSCRAYSTDGNTTVILYGASAFIASSIMSSCIIMKLISDSRSSLEHITKTSWLATGCSNLTEISPFAKVRNLALPIFQLRWPTIFSQRSRLPGVQKTTGG